MLEVDKQSRCGCGWLHGGLASASNRVPVEGSIALLDSSAITLALGLTPGLVLGAGGDNGTLLDAIAGLQTLNIAWKT